MNPDRLRKTILMVLATSDDFREKLGVKALEHKLTESGRAAHDRVMEEDFHPTREEIILAINTLKELESNSNEEKEVVKDLTDEQLMGLSEETQTTCEKNDKCDKCGRQKGDFTHKCLSGESFEKFGCLVCDDNCIKCTPPEGSQIH